VTPQEEQLLQALAERVNSTQLEEKDPDAETFLNRTFSPNPDALYILAQTVLVQNIALEQAKGQVAQLQQQLQQAKQQPAHATSFLGSLLGRRDPQPEPPAPPQPQYVQPQQAPPFQPVQQPQYVAAQPQYVPAQPQFVPQGQPSFLRGAMQTAAGVAAGALAFEGVEAALHGIMGHPGYGFGEPAMGMGGFGMGGGMDRPVEETVINNYYDQPGGTPEHQEQFNQGNLDQGSGEQQFHESADRDGAQFSDASYNTQGNDQGNFDNTDYGDSPQDDSSSFDDGGVDDSGGFDDDGGGNDFA
jgi:uncharacterized protein